MNPQEYDPAPLATVECLMSGKRGGGTQLTLRQDVENLDWASKIAAGWHLCLVVADRLLAARPIGRIVGRDAMNYGWERLNEQYATKLGITPSSLPKDHFGSE